MNHAPLIFCIVSSCAFAATGPGSPSGQRTKKVVAVEPPDVADPDLATPAAPFTLPTPKYKLPIDIKNLVMFSVTTDGSRESILRDEYKTIYKDKKELKAWLTGALDTAIHIHIRSTLDKVTAAANRGELLTVARMMSAMGDHGEKILSQTNGWRNYANSDW